MGALRSRSFGTKTLAHPNGPEGSQPKMKTYLLCGLDTVCGRMLGKLPATAPLDAHTEQSKLMPCSTPLQVLHGSVLGIFDGYRERRSSTGQRFNLKPPRCDKCVK